jgi:hypothetical protein
MGTKTYKLTELEAPLTAALEELWVALESRKPFVIVEEVLSRRFIQFCGSRERRPLLDIPHGQLSPLLSPSALHVMHSKGFRFVRAAHRLEPGMCPGSYQLSLASAASGGKWGVAALRGALGFEDFHEFKIESGGEPMD